MRDGWHPQDVIAGVRKRGSNLQRLARENGFARETLNHALTRRFPNAHKVIADFLGESRGAIWPQWYHPNGKPRFATKRVLPQRPFYQDEVA